MPSSTTFERITAEHYPKTKEVKIKLSTHSVVAVLDRSTPDPFPHPGFCLFAKFYNIFEWMLVQKKWKKPTTFEWLYLSVQLLEFPLYETSYTSDFINVLFHFLLYCCSLHMDGKPLTLKVSSRQIKQEAWLLEVHILSHLRMVSSSNALFIVPVEYMLKLKFIISTANASYYPLMIIETYLLLSLNPKTYQ